MKVLLKMNDSHEFPLSRLFTVQKGKGGYRENLEIGKTPLVSATNKENGVLAHVDIIPTFLAPMITVERVTGQAYVQTMDFATVPDDLFVLVPKEKISLKKLFYVSAQINLQKWRTNYSRKATPKRLRKLKLNLTNFKEEKLNIVQRLPETKEIRVLKNNLRYKEFSLRDLFKVITLGDFHVSSELDEGAIPFISCSTTKNGIIGSFDIPLNQTYEKCMTITSDGEYTFTPFYHPYKFNAQDNVLICQPKEETTLPIIFFIMFQLRQMQWRFSYGRKCYSNKIDKIRFMIPINQDNTINEECIKNLLKNCYGWYLVEKSFSINN